jgi:hypothetical protein
MTHARAAQLLAECYGLDATCHCDLCQAFKLALGALRAMPAAQQLATVAQCILDDYEGTREPLSDALENWNAALAAPETTTPAVPPIPAEGNGKEPPVS